MIKINEIFYSIQGESSLVGLPTVFIRTSGCPLRCTYCDTKYAYDEGEDMTLDQIMAKLSLHPTSYVCVTGGEPLAQKSTLALLSLLCDRGYKVSLETSGQISCKNVDARVKKIIDVKTPDSGAADSFHKENLEFADLSTEYKFIICSEKDFVWSETFSREYGLFFKSNVLYSPSYDEINPQWLAEKILSTGSKARLQLQLHKIIWPASVRGV